MWEMNYAFKYTQIYSKSRQYTMPTTGMVGKNGKGLHYFGEKVNFFTASERLISDNFTYLSVYFIDE